MAKPIEEDVRTVLTALTTIAESPVGATAEELGGLPAVAEGLKALGRALDEDDSSILALERAMGRHPARPSLMADLLDCGNKMQGVREAYLARFQCSELMNAVDAADKAWHARSARLGLGRADLEHRLGATGDKLGAELIFHSPIPAVGEQVWDRFELKCPCPSLAAAATIYADAEFTFGPLRPRTSKSKPPLYRFHPERFEHYTDLKSGPTAQTQALRLQDIEGLRASFSTLLGAIQRSQANTTIRERDAHADGGSAKAMADVHAASQMVEQYRRAGSQLFDFPPGLVEMFRMTEVDDLPMSLLKLPYAAQYVFFGPQDGLELAPGFKVEGAYLVRTVEDVLSITLTTCPPNELTAERWVLMPAPIFTQSFLPQQQTMSVGEAVDHALSDTISGLTKAANAGIDRSNEEKAELQEQTGIRVVWKGKESARRNLEALPRESEVYRRALRLVINAICYVAGYRDDVRTEWTEGAPAALTAAAERPGPEGQRAKTKLEAQGYRLVHLCGIRFEKDRAAAGSRQSPSGHWVRGHWRNVAHGAGRLLRRLQWIMPYKVDGEADERPLGHLYLAD